MRRALRVRGLRDRDSRPVLGNLLVGHQEGGEECNYDEGNVERTIRGISYHSLPDGRQVQFAPLPTARCLSFLHHARSNGVCFFRSSTVETENPYVALCSSFFDRQEGMRELAGIPPRRHAKFPYNRVDDSWLAPCPVLAIDASPPPSIGNCIEGRTFEALPNAAETIPGRQSERTGTISRSSL
jgi:hypothetical protein